jgi:hypothetical protein
MNRLGIFIFYTALIASTGSGGSRQQGPIPIMWREPTDVESRDLFYGIGGKENEPDPSGVYTLVDRITKGTQPKLVVDDDKGRRWVLKTGPEARPETTATRIVWAAGYYVDQDYYKPEVHIVGKDTFLETDVRFERFEPAETDLGHWKWDSNPFAGTRELDGLKVLVALLRDVDVKDQNNQIRRVVSDGAAADVYYLSDLGATLGSTGTVWNKIPFFRNLPADRLNHKAAKADPESFLHGKLIKKAEDDKVVFSARRSSVAGVLHGVSVENARWMGGILGRISDTQLSDAFRAGGFNDDETRVYVSVLRDRINELRSLKPTS